jgi:hypothetical protein
VPCSEVLRDFSAIVLFDVLITIGSFPALVLDRLHPFSVSRYNDWRIVTLGNLKMTGVEEINLWEIRVRARVHPHIDLSLVVARRR